MRSSLVLTRRKDQSVVIITESNEVIIINMEKISRSYSKIRVQANKGVTIIREETMNDAQRELVNKFYE